MHAFATVAGLCLLVALLSLFWIGRLRRIVGERTRELRDRHLALADSEERLLLAQEAAHIGTWDRDLCTGEIAWSAPQAQLFGLPPGSAGPNFAEFLELVHPDDRERLVEASAAAVRDHEQFRCEFRVVRPDDGTVRWLIGIGRASYSDDGTPLRVLGLNMDITERKRLQEQLLQAQKMESVGRLAGGVAHDFNNLLTAITAYTEFAERAMAAGRPVAPHLDSIRHATGRAAELTRQLLAFARKQIIEPRAIDLGTLVIGVDQMLRRLIGEDIELVTRRGDDLWPVLVDPGQIEQVLVNLAVNARDAMPQGGTLVIATTNRRLDPTDALLHGDVPAGDYVQLSVSDTGTGMTHEVLAHAFEPFYTTKPQGVGTGLGLATCYGIVTQSGGHIAVYSEPGQGTTFRVLLPRAAAKPAAWTPAVLGEIPLGQQELVLLVEDDHLVRDVSVTLLTTIGYRVLAAADGSIALGIAAERADEIDLVLTDVVMPQMGGRELATELRRICPRARILFTSGYTDDAMVRRGVLEQDMAFLQKPFTTSLLARKVREVLDRPTVPGSGARPEFRPPSPPPLQ